MKPRLIGKNKINIELRFIDRLKFAGALIRGDDSIKGFECTDPQDYSDVGCMSFWIQKLKRSEK